MLKENLETGWCGNATCYQSAPPAHREGKTRWLRMDTETKDMDKVDDDLAARVRRTGLPAKLLLQMSRDARLPEPGKKKSRKSKKVRWRFTMEWQKPGAVEMVSEEKLFVSYKDAKLCYKRGLHALWRSDSRRKGWFRIAVNRVEMEKWEDAKLLEEVRCK